MSASGEGPSERPGSGRLEVEPPLGDFGQQAVLDSVPANLALLDGDGFVATVNSAWTRFAMGNGYEDPRHGVGTSYLAVCDRATGRDSERAGEVAAGIRAVLAGERETFGLEYPCHSPSVKRWFRLVAAGLGRSGRLRATVMHLDVTDRVEAENALREREAYRHALFQASLDAVAVIDDEGVVRDVNRAVEEILGLRADQVVGQPLAGFVPASERPELGRLAEVLRRTGRLRGLLKLEADGRQVDAEFGAAASFLPGRHLVVFRDVTEQRRLETRLRQAEGMETVGRLAGGIAHDFNNLLTIINGYAELACASISPSNPNRSGLEEIRTAGNRAAQLVQQLLGFSRRQMRATRRLDLAAHLRQLERGLRRDLGPGVAVELRGDGSPVWVEADPAQLDQIVSSLASNARDAMSDGGTFRMDVRLEELDAAAVRGRSGMQPGSWVHLTVSDTGCGIGPDVLPHLFEPFFTTKGVGKGSGLGLATVWGIVQQNGWFVDVESAPGRGTAFNVYLRSSPTGSQAPPVLE